MIDISYPPGPQQKTRRTLLQRANGTDRRIDDRETEEEHVDGHRAVTQTLFCTQYRQYQ